MARFQQGTLDLKLDGIATPDTDNQAANKGYVDMVREDIPVFDSDTNGFVPFPGDSDNSHYYLGGDGRWHLVGSVSVRSYATHYERNFAENQGWRHGDIVTVRNTPQYNTGWRCVAVNASPFNQVTAYWTRDTDTDNARQGIADYLQVGRRVGSADALNRYTITAVGTFSTNIDSTNAPGVRITIDSDFSNINDSPFNSFQDLLFYDDTDFAPGSFLYVGVNNNDARTNDGDWERVSSNTDFFAIDPGTQNVTFTDSRGETAILPSFHRTTAGVVPAPSPDGGSGTTRFLREDGLWSAPIDTGVDTEFTADTDGLVPHPGSARANPGYSLRGDGSWGAVPLAPAVFDGTNNGLVPRPGSGENTDDYFLAGNGDWIHHDLPYVEGIIGNPNTLVTDADYTTVSAAPSSAGQMRLLNSSSADTDDLTTVRSIVFQPANDTHNAIASRMVGGSRFVLASNASPTSLMYVTITGATVSSGVYTFTLSASSTSMHFANGTIPSGTSVQLRLKPATNDIITGQDIAPNSVAHTQILAGVLTPDLLNDGGENPVAGQVLSVNDAGTAFDWINAADAGVTYDSVTAVIGEVDSWFGSDSDYHLLQDTDSELTIGTMRLYGTGPNPDPTLSAPSIFRIEARPHTGRHANVISGMVQGSVLRVTQGNAEVVYALSGDPVVDTDVTPPIYRFQAGSATHYVGTGTIAADSPVTFEFRPAAENPVVPGDFIPGAVRQEDINGGEISPYHMELESTGTANPRQQGYIPVSGGTANGAGWGWAELHQPSHLPAAEGIDTDHIVDVFRIPPTGHQTRILAQNVSYTSLEAGQHWGWIANEPTPTTVNFDTTALTQWTQISESANFNSFYLSNGTSGWNTSTVVPLIDTGNPETCGLVWFFIDTENWGIFQWPAHSLNQGTTNGAIYTNERNLKLVAYEGTPSNSMQVGLNIDIDPVAINTDIIRQITDPQWFLGADDIWHNGYAFFDRAGAASALGYEVDALEKEVNAGIGRVPFPQETANALTAPKEFNGLTVSSDGRSMTFNMARAQDSELWSGFDDLFDDLLYDEDGLATIHFQMAHLDTDQLDTEFTNTDIVFISANDGSNQVFSVDQDSDTFTFQLTNGATFGSNNRITFSDGNGDVIPGDVRGFRAGPGYFRKLIAYQANNSSESVPVDLTNQIDEIGYKSFTYHGTPPSPAIPVISTSDSEQTGRLASIGSGLSYNASTGVLTATGSDADLTWSQVGNNLRLLVNNSTSDPLFINSSDTITFVESTGDNKVADARVNLGSIDSDHLDTDSVFQRHIAATNTPSTGQYLRYTDAGLTWNTVAVGDVEAGYGINLVGADNAITVDTEIIADTDWVVSNIRTDRWQFNDQHYGVVSSTPNLDDTELRQRFLVGTNEWVTIHTLPNDIHRFTYDSDGLVPAPNLPDSDTERAQQYALRANGRWIELPGKEAIFTANDAGLVPPPGQPDEALFLTAAGHWRHTAEIIDSDSVIAALESLVSSWDTDNNSIELGSVVHVPATPGTAATEGSYAEYVITFTQDGSDNIVHDGAEMRFTCPRRQTAFNRNFDSETDYVDVALTNPNISGFAYPPQNPLGLRDVLYAMLDPDNYPNEHTPWDDWIELNKSASDAIRGNDPTRSQLVIGVSTQNPTVDGRGRQGSVDTDIFVRNTLEFNGGQSSDFRLNASFYVDEGTPQTGSWPTRGTPGTPARDTEILILDQQIPIFGTTEQGNLTTEPGLVPAVSRQEADTDYYLTGEGNWRHVREITRDTEHVFDSEHSGVVPAYGSTVTVDGTEWRYELTPNGWQSRNHVETNEAFDVVEKIDALGKVRTGASNGMTWSGGLLRRVLKQVQIGTGFQNFTVVLNWDANRRLTSTQYYAGNFPGTDTLPDTPIATKTLNWDASNQLIGTSIT